MKVHITTKEGTEGVIKKKKVFFIGCKIEFTPEEARLFPDCGTPVTELTPIYEYVDKELEIPKVIRLSSAIKDYDTLQVRSLGQLQQCERMIIKRCLEVQERLIELQSFEVEKSYTVDLIERIREEKEASHG